MTTYDDVNTVTNLTFDFDGTILSFPRFGRASVENTPSAGANSSDVDGITVIASGVADALFEGSRVSSATVALETFDETVLTSGALPLPADWDALFADSTFESEINTIRFRNNFDPRIESRNVDVKFLVLNLEVEEVFQPIPLPAGAPLLVGGLGALVWMRRRARG